MVALKRTAQDSRQQSPSTKYNKLQSNTTQIPTKLNDGGVQTENSLEYKASNKKVRVSEIKKEEDPFLFFSIQRNVSNVLLGNEDDEYGRHGDMLVDGADTMIVPSKVRKTKISCEAHPHIFFESLFSRVGEGEDD